MISFYTMEQKGWAVRDASSVTSNQSLIGEVGGEIREKRPGRRTTSMNERADALGIYYSSYDVSIKTLVINACAYARIC